MKYIYLLVTLVLCNINVITASQDRMKDLYVLTFDKDLYTQGIFQNSVPQLVCIGGDAMKDSHQVQTITCHNIGFNGVKYDWMCYTANLKFAIGNVIVSCEDIVGELDNHIYAKTCSLKYLLLYSDLYYFLKQLDISKFFD